MARPVRAIAIALSHHNFRGWFMTEEIDDINWQAPPPAAILQSYLHRVTGYLRLVTPGANDRRGSQRLGTDHPV